MQILVGRRQVQLPQQKCTPDDVRLAVERRNPPFVVAHTDPSPGSQSTQRRFSIRRRVFLATENARVECENDGELGLACKLVAEDHSRWQEYEDQSAACGEDTSEMEKNAENLLAGPVSDDEEEGGDNAQSEEDISIEEWGQLGYKWFRREDVVYT
jgi:hypothetical protein